MKTDIRGVVQGVGFLPFVHSLDRQYRLPGYVLNDASGVSLEVEEEKSRIEKFIAKIKTESPPVAVIFEIQSYDLKPVGYDDFIIRDSDDHEEKFVPISPDISTCSDCQVEFFDLNSSRYRYIFIIEPTLIAYDLHPEYLATKYALSLQDIPKIGVQHHHAHIVSCMIDNEIDGEAIGVSLEEASGYQFDLQELEDHTLILKEPIFSGIVSDLEHGVGVKSISSKFHNTIAKIILNMCIKIRKTSGLDRVALSGGDFQNRLLLKNTYVLLNKNNFKVFTQHRVPPNDGGIALGQVVIANERIKRKNNPCLFNLLFCAFTFIICVLTLYPQPLVYAADITIAWTENAESDLAGYYIYYKTGTSGKPYNGTGVVEGDSPIKILADSATPEYTLHGLSDTETTYLVLTAYDTGGNESLFSNEVSYQPSTATALSSLSISGSDFVSENNSAAYVATATFSDDTTKAVTGNATWSEKSVVAGINSSGVLTASEVTDDTSVTIQADYTIGGVTKTATKMVTILDVPPSNLSPDTPNIVYPENYSGDVEVPLVIKTAAFSDPNNDGHIQSQWQMSEQSDFSTLVVDITSDNYLTTFPVPHTALKSNQKYYVRVRFYDVYSTASNWSVTVEFTTAFFIVDLNVNGISDADEVDDTVDFNLDGIPDNDQPQIIKCVQASDGSVSIGIQKVSSSAEEIESLEVIDPDTISDAVNRPADLIFGLFAYRLRVTNPGDIATIRIYFSGDILASDVFYKYDTINGWYDYSEHTTFNDDGQSITLEVKDGGFGDSDGSANGVIVDPGGISSGGSTYTGGSESNGASGGSGGGGGGGCFLATADFGDCVQIITAIPEISSTDHSHKTLVRP